MNAGHRLESTVVLHRRKVEQDSFNPGLTAMADKTAGHIASIDKPLKNRNTIPVTR